MKFTQNIICLIAFMIVTSKQNTVYEYRSYSDGQGNEYFYEKDEKGRVRQGQKKNGKEVKKGRKHKKDNKKPWFNP